MTGWLAALPLFLVALSVYDLQRWLERWDYDRHHAD